MKQRSQEITHNDNNGRRYLPGPLPEEPGVGIEPEHEAKILQELVDAVDPGHDRNLQAAEDEGGVGGRVVVYQLQDVHAAVCRHAQSATEHEKTDAQCAPPEGNQEFGRFKATVINLHPPSVLPPEIREPVEEDSDDGLDSGELGAKAEGQEHHEEEDRPEGRDWHP